MTVVMQEMNARQQEAVSHFEGPLLVLAGAGSGKTKVVTQRVVQLIEHGVPASSILGVTFTNKAAGEMKERVNRLTHSHVLICTFHSLGARMLREFIDVLGYRRDFTIYDAEDSEKLLKSCIVSAGIEIGKDNKGLAKELKNGISRAKNDLLDPSDFSSQSTEIDPNFIKIYADYQSKLRECQAVDFDDLLFLPAKLLREFPVVREIVRERWPFLLVDEFQDTNIAQYQLIRFIAGDNQNLFVVGDPDQSIYSWRGANLNNLLNFQKDYPQAKVIRLEQNYRSTDTILKASNAVISHNESRIDKNLWSDLGEGEKIQICTCGTEREEASFVVEQIKTLRRKDMSLAEMVIFYRTNFQSRVFEDALLQARIPYVIIGGMSFYQRKEVKDILAFMRIVHSGSDYISFARTINLPKRGLGEKFVEKLYLGAVTECMPLLPYCEALLSGDKKGVKLSQVHRQGLRDYLDMIYALKEVAEKGSVSKLVEATVQKTGYHSILRADPETYQDRKDNVEELAAKAVEWESLHAEPTIALFLEELTLKSHAEEGEAEEDRLNLMTVHNGKGLEFEAVFLVGMEEGLFPHANAKGDAEAIEEERRLCYVGMTRAKRLLYMSSSNYRYLWGSSRNMSRSRFLNEVPDQFKVSVKSKYHLSSYEKHEEQEALDESFVDYPDEEAIVVGDSVFHKEFGIGQIRKAYQNSMGLTYDILFSKDNTQRSIVAKYGKLQKL